ncbi:hypothetical protein ACFWGP_05415 [Agromyces sp. NPDC127015]|uniref:hypothetical protein n=1 Tax=Agromyces sp. NPDC127015 TaxID=3347108 RepID=UPI00365417D2
MVDTSVLSDVREDLHRRAIAMPGSDQPMVELEKWLLVFASLVEECAGQGVSIVDV